MAKFEVNTTIVAPTSIKIPLIRADHASTSNIFRVFFEVFLSLTATLFGYVLSLATPQPIHWISLVISGCATFSFLGVCVYMAYKSKCSDEP